MGDKDYLVDICMKSVKRNTVVIFDKVYQLLAHGRWFSPGTPDSSTTKIGRHDITEILKHQKSKNLILLSGSKNICCAPKSTWHNNQLVQLKPFLLRRLIFDLGHLSFKGHMCFCCYNVRW
jgi:hypothetical protein